jgi:hypothetical protein
MRHVVRFIRKVERFGGELSRLDIRDLAHAANTAACLRGGRTPVPSLSPEFLTLLERFEWTDGQPEVIAAVEYALAACTGDRIDRQHLPAQILRRFPDTLSAIGVETGIWDSNSPPVIVRWAHSLDMRRRSFLDLMSAYLDLAFKTTYGGLVRPRGFVGCLKSRGHVAPIAETRDLLPNERSLVRWLLLHGQPTAASYLDGVDNLRVIARCGCGCATLIFDIGVRGWQGEGGHWFLSEHFWLDSDRRRCPIFVFGKANVVSRLDVSARALPREQDLFPG